MVCGVKGMFEKQSSMAAAKVLTLICILWAFAVPAMPQQPSDLRRTHTAFHNALRDADASVLERRLDEHFIWTHTDGLVQSKADLLEKIRGGKLRYAELSTDQEIFNEYAKAAVVTGHSKRRYSDAAKPFELRYTLTLVKVGREWKVAAYHTTIFTPGAGQRLQVRLGYPPDAKLLILNADDLAVSHSEDTASFDALDHKLITSATVMVPCPWFTEVAAYAKAHPEADLGLHLTLTAEWETYRWGPIASRALVPSLVGPDGNFYASPEDVAKHAKLNEVETEIRAQIERAKSMGLEPSHLDAHMHTLYRTPELFGVFLKVAREYKLPIRMARNDQPFQSMLPSMAPGDPIPDAIFSPGEDIPASGWSDYYVNLIKNLQPGVTEIFVHLAHDDAETQAIMVNHADWGAAWRQRELETISSAEVRKALADNHVILIGWRDIKKLL
jgi:chitin disaccharide deacetylase